MIGSKINLDCQTNSGLYHDIFQTRQNYELFILSNQLFIGLIVWTSSPDHQKPLPPSKALRKGRKSCKAPFYYPREALIFYMIICLGWVLIQNQGIWLEAL